MIDNHKQEVEESGYPSQLVLVPERTIAASKPWKENVTPAVLWPHRTLGFIVPYRTYRLIGDDRSNVRVSLRLNSPETWQILAAAPFLSARRGVVMQCCRQLPVRIRYSVFEDRNFVPLVLRCFLRTQTASFLATCRSVPYRP